MKYALVGQRFGQLIVESSAGSKRNRRLWFCQCDCGGERIVDSNKLVSGRVDACGCTWGNPTHGYSSTPTYSSWKSMIARCTQPSNPAFKYYKAAGVKLSRPWRKFENFLADMGERPSMAHTIDRYPDKRGNYEPGNCRWATRREQANNRVTNVIFDYRGTKVTLAELARLTGLSKELLRHRLQRAGWSVEDAVTAPKQPGSRRDLRGR